MTKAIKISPNGHVIVVDDMHYDPDYINNCISGYCLALLEFWEHQTFKLTSVIVDMYDERHEIHNVATNILENYIIILDKSIKL